MKFYVGVLGLGAMLLCWHVYPENNLYAAGDLELSGTFEFDHVVVDGALVVHGSLTCKTLIALSARIDHSLVVGYGVQTVNEHIVDIAKSLSVGDSAIVLGYVRAASVSACYLNCLDVFTNTLEVSSLSHR